MKGHFGLTFLFLIILASSCQRDYYQTYSRVDLKPANKDSSAFVIIQMNSDFELYLRRVYKSSEKNKGGKIVTNKPSNGILLEVQYLLVSQKNNQILYITTIPDRKQKYYNNHIENYRDSTWIHIDDFSRFHFGRFGHKNEFEFYSRSQLQKNTWELQRDSSNKRLAIHRIVKRQQHQARERFEFFDEILVGEALEEPVYFNKMPSFQFVLRLNRSGSGFNLIKLKKVRAIYSLSKHHRLYFDFDREANPQPAPYSRISFSKRRIHFFPFY
jgi:hypothetical protein